MNDESFARLVAEDVKNKSTRDQKAYLQLPENWTRWQRALSALIANLSEQITNIIAQEEAVAEKYANLGDEGIKIVTELRTGWEDRRKKIERFRYYVEQKYDEVTRMIAVGGDQVDDRLGLLDFYRKAISKHRELMLEYELDPTSIDEALWDALDGKWNFDGITEENALANFDED
jgi:hypothetical protein